MTKIKWKKSRVYRYTIENREKYYSDRWQTLVSDLFIGHISIIPRCFQDINKNKIYSFSISSYNFEEKDRKKLCNFASGFAGSVEEAKLICNTCIESILNHLEHNAKSSKQ